MEKQIIKLPVQFILKKDTFERVYQDDSFYIYKRNHFTIDYFEVFRRKTIKCIDFDTKKPTGEIKERYPRDEHFGKWAWCCRSFENAMRYVKHNGGDF